MGGSGTSLRVGSELVLGIEPEFGVVLHEVITILLNRMLDMQVLVPAHGTAPNNASEVCGLWGT